MIVSDAAALPEHIVATWQVQAAALSLSLSLALPLSLALALALSLALALALALALTRVHQPAGPEESDRCDAYRRTGALHSP